jgi:hypothetical protein
MSQALIQVQTALAACQAAEKALASAPAQSKGLSAKGATKAQRIAHLEECRTNVQKLTSKNFVDITFNCGTVKKPDYRTYRHYATTRVVNAIANRCTGTINSLRSKK